MPKKSSKPDGEVDAVTEKKPVKKSGKVTKATQKTAKPTTVKTDDKKSKPAAKTTKKKVSKKVVQPVITEQMFYNYFMKLSYTKFIRLTKDWNEENLKITIPKIDDYDAALNYFKTLPPNKIKLLAETGLDLISTESYAALSRWHDIISNPGRIDKIHKAGLSSGKNNKTIIELAAKNDRYGVLKAIRNELAEKLQKGAGNRDTADLSKQMMEVMTQIADYEKRLAHTSKKTVLGELLADIPTGSEIAAKRPARNGKGHRQTSFASRVTIKDVEGGK